MIKFTNLSFRKKVCISYLLLFIIFLTLFFPFASHSVRRIVYKTFKQRVLDLISTISKAQNTDELIKELSYQQKRLFFRVTLLNPSGDILFDSFPEEEVVLKKPLEEELQEALKGSTGYNEEYSAIMGQELIYVARSFDFKNQTIILRAAFPFKQFDELISDFELGFLSLGSVILLLFASLTWIIMHHLSKPIHRIIQLVKPYQEGVKETLPKLENDIQLNEGDDFDKLAFTLNSLSEKIQSHIDTLTLERNNKEIILDSLAEGIIAIDANFKITYANKFISELFSIPKEETSDFLINPSLFSKYKDLVCQCLKDKKSIETSINLPQQKKHLQVIAVPMTSQNGAVLVLQDKSSHYKLIEIGKDFVANASHELKTPITIIRGFAETLFDHPELSKEVSKEIIGKIVRNCERMETLVKNLLILADVENLPRSRLQETNLKSIIENCMQIVLNVYSSAMITFEVQDKSEIHIIADPDLLELAIVNLLTNAAKYSKPPAKITIQLQQPSKNIIKISVKDQGIGIPQEDLENIFDRFYTVDKAHSRKLGGSGLGLSITKTIIEKHQGKIEVKSLLGIGSEFLITLPIELMNIDTL